ncbi:MAG: hypothetical protein AAFZ10_13300 [Pseudomonadota bacterium]
MTNPTEARPGVYKAYRISAGVVAGAAVLAAAYIILSVGLASTGDPSAGGAIILLLIPMIMFGFAVVLWLSGKAIERIDRARTQDAKQGRSITGRDYAIFAALLAVLIYMGRNQLSPGVDFHWTEYAIVYSPAGLAALVGGAHLLALKRGRKLMTQKHLNLLACVAAAVVPLGIYALFLSSLPPQ